MGTAVVQESAHVTVVGVVQIASCRSAMGFWQRAKRAIGTAHALRMTLVSAIKDGVASGALSQCAMACLPVRMHAAGMVRVYTLTSASVMTGGVATIVS